MAEEQLTIFDLADETPADEEISAEDLFEPNGRQRCPGCRRPMTPFAGRLYCLSIGCPGVS